jgi:hypothetical protein
MRSSDDKDAEFMKTYEKTAQEHSGKMVFAYSDMTGTKMEKLIQNWDLDPKDMPMLVGYVPKGNKIMHVKESIKDVNLADLSV